MAAGRPTQWLLFPPPSHTLIQFVMGRRDGGRFNLSQKETLKWTSGGGAQIKQRLPHSGGEIRTVRVARGSIVTGPLLRRPGAKVSNCQRPVWREAERGFPWPLVCRLAKQNTLYNLWTDALADRATSRSALQRRHCTPRQFVAILSIALHCFQVQADAAQAARCKTIHLDEECRREKQHSLP